MNKLVIIGFVLIASFFLLSIGLYHPQSTSQTYPVVPKLGEAEILIANGTWTAIYYKVNGYDIYQDSNYNTVIEWAMNQTRNQP